jgi:Putative MetA-pathway of phenol degradation
MLPTRAVARTVLVVSLAPTCWGCASFRGASTLAGGIRPFAAESAVRPPAAPDDADAPQIQPDRPDVTNAAYTVPKGLVQIEVGGQHSRVPVSGESTATPVSLRFGVAHWCEAQVESDGLARDKEPSATSTQFPGLTVGGKFRLWAPRNGTPVITVMPAVALPWGRPGGGTDYLLRVISGGDLPRHLHLDVNYGVGAIAADEGGHFPQQMASASANVGVGKHWNPYAEIYWFSKLQPDARPTASIDAGAMYTVTERLAVDGGVAFGLTNAANGPAVFGGLSIIVGAVGGHASVHARLRDAQARGDR